MNVLLVVLGLLAATPPAAAWQLVGQVGPLKLVYVEPAKVKDTKFLAKVVDDMIQRFGTQSPMQVDFFDNREQTPTTRPYTSTQKLHQRAKFNFNPKNGMRRFAWVNYAPEDPNQPTKLKLSETEETLPFP